MKQVIVVILLSFALSICVQVQYRVEYVLIDGSCCAVNNSRRLAESVVVEYRNATSWERLQNLEDIES